MKILTVNQIKEADAYTIKNEPVASADLMERAASAIAGWFAKKFPTETSVKIFSGPGNNGGDGLALARMLYSMGYNTKVFLMASRSGYSADTSVNIGRLGSINLSPQVIEKDDDFPEIAPSDVVVDALFGTGLSRPLTGMPASLINYLNQTRATIVAVDIPSGLFGDDNRSNTNGTIIRANYTLSFQFPKPVFMFAENEKFTGRWEILPIGLHQDFIDKISTPFHLTDPDIVKSILKKRTKFSHKGQFGHSLLIAGSYGKMGAAVLGTAACLRTGAGLVTAHVPVKGCEVLQISVPEAMVSIDESDICFSVVPSLEKYDAIGAGPGIGTDNLSQKAIYELLHSAKKPLVLDADALNIISLNKSYLELIPENSILTPHPGEFDRIAGQHKNGHDRLISQIEIAKKYNLIIVLKGAFTSIAIPDGSCYFNGSGNPGMATAGSGDVLTGILLSLLGQGYSPADAAIAGVYIHGLAGDIALDANSPESLIAGEIIKNIGNAFNLLKK